MKRLTLFSFAFSLAISTAPISLSFADESPTNTKSEKQETSPENKSDAKPDGKKEADTVNQTNSSTDASHTEDGENREPASTKSKAKAKVKAQQQETENTDEEKPNDPFFNRVERGARHR